MLLPGNMWIASEGYLSRGEALAPVAIVSRDMAPIAAVVSSDKLSSLKVVPNMRLTGSLSDAGLSLEVTEKLVDLSKVPRLVDALEVSCTSSRSLEEVMAAFEEADNVGHAASLDNLLDDAPADGRWVSWQIRGIRDDLALLRVKACTSALVADSSIGPKDAVRNWQIGQSRDLAQVQRLIDQARRYPKDSVALGSLAIRVLYNTIHPMALT